MSKFILIRWVLDNALDVCPLSALESKEIRERLTNDADAIGPLRGSRVDVNRWEEPEEAIIIDAGLKEMMRKRRQWLASEAASESQANPQNSQLEEENAALRAQLVVLQAEVLAERQLTRRLLGALLDKIDLLVAHPAVLSGVEIIPQASSSSFVEASDSASPTPSVLVPPHLAQPVLPRPLLSQPVLPQLVPPQPASAQQEPVPQALAPPVPAPQAPAPPFLEPPVLAPPQIEVQEQVPAALPAQEEPVELPGNAAEVQPFLEPGDMEALMDASTDSIFVRDISRKLWPDDLRNRSLTGTPCRRFLKSGALGRRALSPQKLKYVRCALATYIKKNPSPVVSAALRLRQLNTHMRRLLGDENRKRH
ncbi:formin-like protein 1 isoform X1 [Ixodes scapularis]|uniref:formin-like protein 1 isoform X1 n=1 Tax=Ixodes scapularis TaxID=6945 RepID=UPI001C382296|nr:formin-like protein 1 isoform X1 [Ixodes scapularis]